MNNKEFEERKKYSEASGTMAVIDSNIRMILNKEGLFEESIINPSINISSKAEFVSPNFNTEYNESKISSELYGEIPSIKEDPRIGYYKSLYVGHVLEDDFRKNASSGGMGTWILKELLENDLVDYVIHVKKNKDTTDKKLFKYDISSNVSEIKDGAKTRYYPVEVSEVFDVVKKIPGRYAIIGIPSFIYAIRLLCKADNDINERIKYTVGLICGHQKSTKFSESIAWQVGIKPGDLIDIDFRHKFLDKPANQYGVKMKGVVQGEERTIIKPTSDLFGQNWGWGFFKPIASNYTDDVFNETADIVLGDAWLPDYANDSKGNNVIIVRSSELNNIIENGIKSGKLKMDVVSADTIYNSQSSHYQHTHDELAYRLHKKIKLKEWVPIKRVTPSNNIGLIRKRIQDLRESLSEKSHEEYLKAIEQNNFTYYTEKMKKELKGYQNVYRIIKWQKKLGKYISFLKK